MGRKILFSFSLLFLCVVFSLTLDQIFARKNVRRGPTMRFWMGLKLAVWKASLTRAEIHLPLPLSLPYVLRLFTELELNDSTRLTTHFRTSSSTGVIRRSGQQKNGDMKPIQNFTVIPITQALNYNLSKERWSAFSHHNPVKFSRDGIPCILFWTKRITIKFKNQIWLDLTDETFGQNTTVDTGNSSCTEERATLSLKFGDAEDPKDLDIRFILTNYNKLSSQSWFSLHRVEIIFNNSVQASFNATGIHAPSSYSYHCQRISSLQRNDALLLPSSTDDIASLWEVTFIDFQIQGFDIKGAQFAQARDCVSSFSPAVLIGLAMSLILLLVLAYALHMLIYLRYLDRHYEFITSPAHFPPLKALGSGEEKELLESQGTECYELRSQQICKIYV